MFIYIYIYIYIYAQYEGDACEQGGQKICAPSIEAMNQRRKKKRQKKKKDLRPV